MEETKTGKGYIQWKEHAEGIYTRKRGNKYVWTGITHGKGVHMEGSTLEGEIPMERGTYRRSYTWRGVKNGGDLHAKKRNTWR